MANICYALQKELPEELVEVVVVQSGQTLVAGNIVLAETLVSGSKKNYVAGQVATIATDLPCIIIDQGFEQLADGRRPDGSDITALSFTEGAKLTAVRLVENFKYEMATANIDNTGVIAPAVGKFLIPQAGSLKLATSDTLSTAKVGFKIEAVTSIPVGGQLGLGFASAVVAKVVFA
jgi:hypothetical protein